MTRTLHDTRIFLCFILWAQITAPSGMGGDNPAQNKTPATLLGVETIPEPLPFYDGSRHVRVRDTPPSAAPMHVILSRSRYWAEDGHLDVIVQLVPPEEVEAATTTLAIQLTTPGGETLSSFEISPIPSERFIFYPRLPEDFSGDAEITLSWKHDEEVLAVDTRSFRVENHASPAVDRGHVSLHIPNPDKIHQTGLPFTVGVPFPRGTLRNPTDLRLKTQSGDSIPLQTRELARWSKFGSVKWVLCDFVLDLDGNPVELELHYQPTDDPQPGWFQRWTRRLPWFRSEASRLTYEESDGFPIIQTGRLKFDDGLWFDAKGDGRHTKVLDESALSGAFIKRAGNGTSFVMDTAEPYEVEDAGSEKIVLRREGWYRDETTDSRFCRYITRMIIHRDSPLVRLFHTWIFTGDGNQEQIANMGWEFPLADGIQPAGFLTGEDSAWQEGGFLLQYDFDQFEISDGTDTLTFHGARAPGAAMARGHGVALYFGAKDFWQNYPSELEFAEGSLWFHNWPRHNKPSTTTFDGSELDSELRLNVLQARWAHEGECLDFQLPDAFFEDPLWSAGGGGQGPTPWLPDPDPDYVNAQGISRTEEMWIYLAPATQAPAHAARVLDSLNEERLRAVVDPAWIAASGAFYEIHPYDPGTFPELEETYAMVAQAPARWAERLGSYGMWIYGDLPAWNPSLDNLKPDLYRAWRKTHHGWPYSWLPYARSGNSEYLKYAEAATRQMIDVSYCHYIDDQLPHPRRPGFWSTSHIPWAGGLRPSLHGILNKVDYLLHAYYLTGYERALENLLDWAEAAKAEAPDMDSLGGALGYRTPAALLKAYLETYEATFDPWFLAAAHAIAEGHRDQYQSHGWTGLGVYSGDREFLRFSGCDEHREHFLNYADSWGAAEPGPFVRYGGLGWFGMGVPFINPNAYAWHLTGDERYLRRTAAFVDPAFTAVYEGEEPDYLQGYFLRGGTSTAAFTGYYLNQFPVALEAIASCSSEVIPIHHSFTYALPAELAFQKPSDISLPLRLANVPPGQGSRFKSWGTGRAQFDLRDPSGQSVDSDSWGMNENISGHVQAPLQVEIPAAAPAGVYHLSIEPDPPEPRHWTQSVLLPVAPADTPQILLVPPSEAVAIGREGHLWFMVPEDLEEFTIRVPLSHHNDTLASIWNPDGRRVWALNFYGAANRNESWVETAVIKVPPAHAGRLWRLVLPHGGRFEMDPAIPPIYALYPDQWFQPALHDPAQD